MDLAYTFNLPINLCNSLIQSKVHPRSSAHPLHLAPLLGEHSYHILPEGGPETQGKSLIWSHLESKWQQEDLNLGCLYHCTPTIGTAQGVFYPALAGFPKSNYC